jgi:hypothetical protein
MYIYFFKIWNIFSANEYMSDNADLNVACESIRGNMKSSDNEILDYYELH